MIMVICCPGWVISCLLLWIDYADYVWRPQIPAFHQGELRLVINFAKDLGSLRYCMLPSPNSLAGSNQPVALIVVH